jgi:hypothetical protein
MPYFAGTQLDIDQDCRSAWGNEMGKYLAPLVFAGYVLAASPLSAAPSATAPADESKRAVAVQQVRVPLPGLRDEAAMVLVGTLLIGLAAAVRRRA